MTRTVVVVGGGISGLATAYFLQEGARKSGVEIHCTVVEEEGRLGGKVLTESIDGLTIEAGPDSFLTLKPQALDLCKRLGLGGLLMGTNDALSQVFVYCDGKLRTLPQGTASVVPTRLTPFFFTDLLTTGGKARMLLDVLLRRRRDECDESLADFVRRRLGREALERLAEPLMAGIYAGDAERLSMQANFPQLVRLEASHRSLILGTLKKRRSATMGGTSGREPAFMTIRGGLRLLVEALVSGLRGAQFLTGQKLATIGRNHSGVDPAYTLGFENGSSLGADLVVLASPAYESARLLQGINPAAASILDGIPYASTATVSLAYDRGSFSHPLDGSGFLVAPTAKRKITACTWVSSKWPAHSPPDRVLLRCFVGRFGDDAMLQLGDDELCRLVRDELQSILGVSGEPLLKRVHRFPRSMPQYVVGHLEKLGALEEAISSTPGILLTGAAYGGVGLPDCVRQAALTAELALESGARGREEAIPGVGKSAASD